MAFEDLEESVENGRPVYLYRFSLNDKFWRYTSADGDIRTNDGEGEDSHEVLWKAVPIADDGPKQTGESATDALTITAWSGIVPAQLYMQYPPARPVQVAIFITHEEETGVYDTKAIYMGEVTQCSIPSPGTAKFTCETFSATMDREGLRLGWQRGCPYALYDQSTCKLDPVSNSFEATVTNITGDQVTVDGMPADMNGRFRGGFIEWVDSVRGIERRAVENNTGSVLLMFGSANGLAIGTTITIFLGCARTVGACQQLGNFDNYGGIPRMQGRSPFDGNPVFN